MPPKQTPYQFKKGLTYVKQVPRFLQGLTSQTNDDERSQVEKEDINCEETSDDELNAAREEERPQIVVLKEGKHMSEQEVKAYLDREKSKEKDSSSVEDKESDFDDEDTPVVDKKTGKILFRKPKTKKIFTGKTTSVVGSHSMAKNESNMPIKTINEIIDGMKRKRDNNEIENDKSGKKVKSTKKKSQKVKSHLSFNDDEI